MGDRRSSTGHRRRGLLLVRVCVRTEREPDRCMTEHVRDYADVGTGRYEHRREAVAEIM